MRPTSVLRDQYGLQSGGVKGVHPWRNRVPYETFKSQYGPNVRQARVKFGQYDLSYFRRIAYLPIGFGAAAGIFALFFFDGVPRVQRDIFQKIPVIGSYFKHEVAPEDNPF